MKVIKKIKLIPACFYGVAVAALIVGCAPVKEIRGNLLDDKKLQELTIGQSTQRDVIAVLGSPTATSVTVPNEWYYIGQKTSQIAVYQPEVLERRVFVMNFNDEGVLEKMTELNKDQGNDLEFSGRETESGGRKFTIMQQLIGNLGRFNKDDFQE